MSNQSRQPKGVPVGGRFTTTARTETHTTLSSSTTPLPDVTLGATTYRVESTTSTFPGRDGARRTRTNVTLTGPRGAQYLLREYTGQDDGLRQVISLKSGQPLRVLGREVQVWHLGDIIETTRPPARG